MAHDKCENHEKMLGPCGTKRSLAEQNQPQYFQNLNKHIRELLLQMCLQ